MKIQAFHVKDGDCLLIRCQDDSLILVDGGRIKTFEEHVMPALNQLEKEIDLLFISHIDGDQILGALPLVETEIAWRVFDFQSQDDKLNAEKPKLPRPSGIGQIWHNGLTELVDDQDGQTHSALTFARKVKKPRSCCSYSSKPLLH